MPVMTGGHGGTMPGQSQTPKREMTRGEYLVGITFNPAGHPAVDDIKRKAADLIDAINNLKAIPDGSIEYQGEFGRCKATAITNVEQGAMWAVKAATKPILIDIPQ